MKLSRIPGGPFTILAVTIIIILSGAWLSVEWGYNRVWVPEGHSMLLRYKGPPLPIPGLGTRQPARQGAFAKVSEGDKTPAELGVLENLVGPGRHFYCPLWWETEIRPDIVIEPGEVGIAVCKMGEDLPTGDFLVDGDLGGTTQKGILRKVLPPGRYRVNWHAYEVTKTKTELIHSGTQVKQAGWVSIPTGYVGVVTNLADNPLTNQKSGIQPNVLPPGIYPINPREQQVDIVNIGYRELSIIAELKKGPDGLPLYETSGEPIIGDPDSGIGFPSNDGFDIHMDFTAIWGIMPDQAPDVISRFGNVDAVEKNVVVPQIESICRNEGSKLGAVELLVGESRQEQREEVCLGVHVAKHCNAVDRRRVCCIHSDNWRDSLHGCDRIHQHADAFTSLNGRLCFRDNRIRNGNPHAIVIRHQRDLRNEQIGDWVLVVVIHRHGV